MKINKQKIFGEDLLQSCFSFNGTIGRLGFLGFFWLLSVINSACSNVVSLALSIVIFYATLVITQKRCRDFNYNGTIFILIYSIYYLTFICWLYMKPYKDQLNDVLTEHPYIKYSHATLFFIYLFSVVLLLIIPGKKEKDLNLRSPLLKKPWLYTCTCFIIYSICLFAVIYWHKKYLAI